MELTAALYRYCDSPFDARCCFDLAWCYEQQGQLASAFGYYLRAAQQSDQQLINYESLLRAAFCFDNQGSRPFSTKCLYEYAIGTDPRRPEAYYHVCRFLERKNSWSEILLFSSCGVTQCLTAVQPSITDLKFPGVVGLKFYKALSLYYLGDAESSHRMFAELNNDKTLCDPFDKLVANNLSFVSTLRAKNYPG